MVDVPLRLLGVEGVDHLGHAEHPQRGHVQDLGLAPLEQPGAVGPGDQAHLGGELADLVGPAAVQADPLVQDPAAHHPALEVLERRGDLRRPLGVRLLTPGLEEVLLELVLHGVQPGLALQLRRDQRGSDPVAGELLHGPADVLVDEAGGLERPPGSSGLGQELLLEVEHLRERFLGRLQALGHDLLGGLGGAVLDELPGLVRGLALDHQHVDAAGVVAPSRHHHVEGGQVELLVGRVDLPLPADQAHPDGADRALEREPRQHRGDAGAVDGGYVVEVGHVRRQHRDHDVDLVPVPLGEGRPERTVHQPGGQDGGLGRAALPAEEPAGDLAGRVHPLLHVHGQREEVDPLAGVRAGTGGEDLGLADGHHDGPARLLGELARLEGDVGAPDGSGGVGDRHWLPPLRPRRGCACVRLRAEELASSQWWASGLRAAGSVMV